MLIAFAVAVPSAAAQTAVGCGTSSGADGEQMIFTGDLNCVGTAVIITINNQPMRRVP
jgi:hypothetical protein